MDENPKLLTHMHTDSHTQPFKCSYPLKYKENTIIMVKQWALTISEITEPHQHAN